MMIAGLDVEAAGALWAAYCRTVYVAIIDGHELQIRVGRMTPDLDAELTRRQTTTWAFITASNPGSQVLSSFENRARQLRLEGELLQCGLAIVGGEGRAPDGVWAPEASVLVFGISELEAGKVGERYGQLAIVCGQQQRPAKLVAGGIELWCGKR